MRVQITDKPLLSSISIASLRSYLESREWIDDGQWGGGRAILYVKEGAGRSWDILVPTRDTVGDYASGMADALAVLADVEDRSQLDVFQDLMSAGADVIRVRSLNGLRDKPLSLRRRYEMYQDAYRMVESAARAAATNTPQANYRGQARKDVLDYLDVVQPMPDDYNGYALTLRSPVPKGFGTQEDLGDDFHAPFPRRATAKLAQALTVSLSAVEEAVASDDLEPFRKAVPHGVSSNLCKAVANLAENGEGVEIGLSWASVRPTSDSAAASPLFAFSKHSADILGEVARVFLRDEPSMNEKVIAHVIKLERKPEEFDGRADLSCNRENRSTRLKVEFGRESYDTVIKAFQDRAAIELTGDIYRESGKYELRNPRYLSIPEGSA